MAKVYVSSTVADLEQERRTVMGWLVEAGHLPVQSYVASSETVRDSCLDDVDGCDLFVLILGNRYGFVPEDGNPEGLSITHLEFRRAGQSGIRQIALLRTSFPGAGFSGSEDPQQARLVAAFRAEVTRTVRAAEFDDLRGLIQKLSIGVQAELGKLPPPVLRLAPRPPFLAGRDDLLADLDERLAGDDREPRIVALHGMAGAGKTSLALAYVHDHLAQSGITWQFAAEDPTVLAAGFADLAAALGSREGTGDPVVAVHGALAASRASWLLIFDNVPGPEAVQAFLPPAGRGRVLVTSRNALWPPGQLMEVPVLDTEVAAGFLIQRTGDSDDQAAASLAEALDGLPLALEQAAAYIQATGHSLAGYLTEFQQRQADLLARGEPAGYPGTVATAWVLAFDQLEQSKTGAAGLLRLLAFCAPEAIPLGLLLKSGPRLTKGLQRRVAKVLGPLLDDPLVVGDAVAALRRYSLVRLAGDGAVTVHRLVQAVTAEQMPEEQARAWRQAASVVIEAAIPADPQDPDTWPTFAELLPHARKALTADSDAMRRVASYLGYRGNYVAARELWRELLQERVRNLGPQHPGTLLARENLATWAGMAGDAVGARDQYAALLPIRERVSGPEHPETLATRSNLAFFTGMAGDAAGARDLFVALLPIRQRVLGPEHPETLTTRANLALWTGEAGDAAGARDLYAALLRIEERVLGPEHPKTLTTRGALARWTGEAGDAAGARDQLAALLPIQEGVLGPEHPDTLMSRGNLAQYTGAAGDAAGARDLFAALLPVRERVYGSGHPETLGALHNLAAWTGAAGNAAGARDLFAALLPAREQVSGPRHPETLHTRSNLAYWTGAAGDAAGARDQYVALLPITERVRGPEHPDTLATRGNLAGLTGAAGDAAGARDQYVALLPVVERVLGPEHPNTLHTRANLATWTGLAGDAAGARDQFAALLPTFEQVRGPEHPDTLAARAVLASWAAQADRGTGPNEG